LLPSCQKVTTVDPCGPLRRCCLCRRGLHLSQRWPEDLKTACPDFTVMRVDFPYCAHETDVFMKYNNHIACYLIKTYNKVLHKCPNSIY
jgi:hypothetical protein